MLNIGEDCLYFEILGEILEQETMAVGRQIREIEIATAGGSVLHKKSLRSAFGVGAGLDPARGRPQGPPLRLRMLAAVRFADGTIVRAEVHWYEAHGVGSREFKIKRILEGGP